MNQHPCTSDAKSAPSSLYNSTIQVWIHLLKNKYTLRGGDPNPNCPAYIAMRIFAGYTKSLIAALEASDPGAVTLTVNGYLYELYTDLPDFHDFRAFHNWVADGLMKHPQRKSGKQYHFYEVVKLGLDHPDLGWIDGSTKILTSVNEWYVEAYKPENLVQDPDELWAFHNCHDVKPTSSASHNWKDIGTTCLVCAEYFDEENHSPHYAPCSQKHIFCKSCFAKWLYNSNGEYKCPLCRACLICGHDDCYFHRIQRDVAEPLPITYVMNRILGHVDDPLHGIAPEQYWKIRENTRTDRATLNWIEHFLVQARVNLNDPVYKKYLEQSNELWVNIKEAVGIYADYVPKWKRLEGKILAGTM